MLRWFKKPSTSDAEKKPSRKWFSRAETPFFVIVILGIALGPMLFRERKDAEELTYRNLLVAMDEGRVEKIRIVPGERVLGWWSPEADEAAAVAEAAELPPAPSALQVTPADAPSAGTARANDTGEVADAAEGAVDAGAENKATPKAGKVEEPKPDFFVHFPNYRSDTLLERADRAGVEIEFSQAPGRSAGDLVGLLVQVLFIGLIGYLIFMQTRGGGSNGIGQTATSTTTFADVAGLDGAVEELREVADFLKRKDAFERVGARPVKGALLAGPPGTGKTLLARAVAGEAGLPFYSISGSEVTGFLVGLGAMRIRGLFKKARKTGGVIFIDEIDALGGTRGRNQSHNEDDRTLNQLLVEMDGFSGRDNIVVLGATNREDSLDPALKRPGRLDRLITVGLPDTKGREAILAIHVKKQGVPISDDVDLSRLARLMPGASGADLAHLVNEAAIHAARVESPDVRWAHFEAARDRTLLGKERVGFRPSDDEYRLVAYHEAGHALVGVLACPEDGLHKVTIQARGQALGVAFFSPDADRHLHSRRYLQGMLQKAMGGRAAEEIIFGADHITSGAKSDLIQANRIAREMIYFLGMGKDTGLLVQDPQSAPLSGAAHAEMDREVKELLARMYEETIRVLRQNEAALHALAQALLERETLDGAEAIQVMEEAGLDRHRPLRGAHALSAV
jgi:cell division protease FtsH